jgi:copper chaperone
MALQISVPSMVCDGCAGIVTGAITAIDPAATVQVNLGTKLVTIETQASAADVTAAITAAGHVVG